MRPTCKFRDAIYEQFARIGKAVSSPKRLELLDLLSQTERTVEAIANEAGISIANASQHLQVLRSAGLVVAQKQGIFVTYRLADDRVCEFVQAMKTLAESRLAEIEQIRRQFRESHPDLTPVDCDTLRERIDSGAIVLVDVRPREEYQAGHIAGALCMPLDELEQRPESLPRDQEIVAYCRGPYCIMAAEAVEQLRAKGFRASHMEEGVREWRAGGGEVEIDVERKD